MMSNDDGRRFPPESLDDIIGLDHIVKDLKLHIKAAKANKEPLNHVLFYGPPGSGKATLARVVANEMGVRGHFVAGPSIERGGDLAAILTHLRSGDVPVCDVLVIEDIHRLGKTVEEILYPVMEDSVLEIVVGKGLAARTMPLRLPKFTIVGTTPRIAMLTAAMRSRFGGEYRLDFYNLDALSGIVTRAAAWLKIPLDSDRALEIARRARGTPAEALRLLYRLRDAD